MNENFDFDPENNRVNTAKNATGMNKSLFSPSNMQRNRVNGSEMASHNKELITSYDGNSSNYMNKMMSS